MTKSSQWVLLAVCNVVALSGAAWFVAISGRLAGVIPALVCILVADIRTCRHLLQSASPEPESTVDETI